MPIRTRFWAELRWPEFRDLPENTVAVLPIAATEQHGPHLPLGTDVMIGEAYLARVQALTPADGDADHIRVVMDLNPQVPDRNTRAGEAEAVLGEMAARLKAAGAEVLQHRGMRCDPFAAPEVMSVAEAFREFAGIDLLATCEGAETDAAALRAQVQGIRLAEDDTWSDILSRVLVEKVEPHLGRDRPLILDRYPAAEAALARPAADPREAERFELYACGVELANGFGELTDPAEQRRRFVLEMDEKARVYGERYPLDEDFLAALDVMPAASGCALGFDRLVMLATGAPRIEDVLWTPVVDFPSRVD